MLSLRCLVALHLAAEDVQPCASPQGSCSQVPAIAVVVLVGNKTDLAEDRVISEEEGQDYATR